MRSPPSRILVGSDFSSSATAALEVASDLARRAGAELTLVHSVRDPVRLVTGYEVIDELLAGPRDPRQLEDAARARLERAAKDAHAAYASLRIVVGDPAAELCALRSTLGADLLVLGTGHLRGLRGLLLGSVADRVLRNPGPPLLLVRSVPEGGSFRRILVCAEWTDRVEPPLSFCAGLLEEVPADLFVLHVLPPHGYVTEEHRVVIEPDREEARLAATVRRACPDAPARLVLRHGEAVHVIPQVAHEIGADLVAVGAQRNEDGWPGRITDRIARSDVPSLVIVWPPQEPSRGAPPAP